MPPAGAAGVLDRRGDGVARRDPFDSLLEVEQESLCLRHRRRTLPVPPAALVLLLAPACLDGAPRRSRPSPPP